jgi:hypothetical protein
VFRKVARAVGEEPKVLGGADRAWGISKTRALVGYVLIRRLGYRLREVSLCLGRDVAMVSSLISRFSARMTKDEELKKQVERIAKIV